MWCYQGPTYSRSGSYYRWENSPCRSSHFSCQHSYICAIPPQQRLVLKAVLPTRKTFNRDHLYRHRPGKDPFGYCSDRGPPREETRPLCRKSRMLQDSDLVQIVGVLVSGLGLNWPIFVAPARWTWLPPGRIDGISSIRKDP